MSHYLGLLGVIFFLAVGIGVIVWCLFFGADDDDHSA
jgi:hypothetical protein